MKRARAEPIPENLVITWLYTARPLPARPSSPQENQCPISHFLASLGAQENWYYTHITYQCCDQLTAVRTGYPLTSNPQVPTQRGWQVTSFQRLTFLIFFKIHMKYVVFMCRTIKILILNGPRTRNSASYYGQGRQLLLIFLTMVTRWSRSTSNFYALIGQNLAGEFMRKIYTASWNLFTLTAEADRRSLCQLVMFLTVFFHWMYKMKFTCYEESSVIHG